MVVALVILAGADAVADEPPFARFTMTSAVCHCDDDMDAIVMAEFGPQASVADWTTIKFLFSDHIEAFCDYLGLTYYSAEAWCYANGDGWWSPSRHYFVSRHEHDCPDWWLAHDDIDDHFLDLGSWCGDFAIIVDLGLALPVAAASDATEVTETSATLNGFVSDDAGEACQYRFRYRRSDDSYYSETSWTGSVTTGQSFSYGIGGLTPGFTYVFEAQVQNSVGPGDWSEQRTFVTPGVSGSVQVLAPNGGETLVAGSTANVRWQTEGDITMVTIQFSADAGATWTFVVTCGASSGQHAWTAPAVDSDHCLIQISAGNDTSICDASDATFSIRGAQTSATWYVDAAASGNRSGTSWADAFVFLQDAMARASARDEVWVAQGVYRPDAGVGQTPGNRAATFQLKDGVAVYGGFATGGGTFSQRNADLYDTVLNGDIGRTGYAADNSYHVVTASGTGNTAILDGFTITGGCANTNPPHDGGAGMYSFRGSPLVRNCTFVANVAAVGSGGGACNINSAPRYVNCIFNANTAAVFGGAMYNEANDVTVVNCTFSANHANTLTGGVFNSACTATLANSILWGNSHHPVAQVDEWAQVGGTQSQIINFCCLAGWTGVLGGTGNFGLNPMFFDANGPDGIVGSPDDALSLKTDSPCINKGHNASVPAGVTTDCRGRPRIVNGTVDMGAYEDQTSSGRHPAR